MAHLRSLAVVALFVGGCDGQERRPAPLPAQPRTRGEAPVSAPTPSADPSSDPSAEEPGPTPEPDVEPVARAPGIGPAAPDAPGTAEARRAAVLDILAGGPKAERLPLEATDPGQSFDPHLVQKMAPPTDDGLAGL